MKHEATPTHVNTNGPIGFAAVLRVDRDGETIARYHLRHGDRGTRIDCLYSDLVRVDIEVIKLRLDEHAPRWSWADWGPHSQSVRTFARQDVASVGDKVETCTRLGTLYTFTVEDLAPLTSRRGTEIALRSMAATTRHELDASLLRHAAEMLRED